MAAEKKELTPEQKKQRRESMMWDILIAVIVIALGAYFYLSMGRTEFLEYKDTNYKFKIDYPSDWTVNTEIDGTVVAFVSPKQNQLDVFQENVNIVVQKETQLPKQLKLYALESVHQLEFLFEDDIEILEQGFVDFAGSRGYEILYLGKTGTETNFKVWQVIGIHERGWVYQFTYTTLESQYDKFVPEMRKMYNSFRSI